MIRTTLGYFSYRYLELVDHRFSVFGNIIDSDECPVPNIDIGLYGVIVDSKPKKIVFCKLSRNFFFAYKEPFKLKTTPSFDSNTKRFYYDIYANQGFYDILVSEGMAEEEVVNRLLVCPKCNAIPSLRLGCGNCGSIKVETDLLIHHYACGMVDFKKNFIINEENGTLTCHKCNKPRLVINIDYDVSHGLNRCLDCSWTGNSKKLIGECLSCQTNFLIDEAKEIEIKRYKFLYD